MTCPQCKVNWSFGNFIIRLTSSREMVIQYLMPTDSFLPHHNQRPWFIEGLIQISTTLTHTKRFVWKIRGKEKKTKSQERRKHLFSVKFAFNNNTPPSTFFFSLYLTPSLELSQFSPVFHIFFLLVSIKSPPHGHWKLLIKLQNRKKNSY